MKYTQFSLFFKASCNICMQKSDLWLIVELKMLSKKYTEMKEFGKKNAKLTIYNIRSIQGNTL